MGNKISQTMQMKAEKYVFRQILANFGYFGENVWDIKHIVV